MTKYTIQLRPAPSCRVPDDVALRKVLKALLRQYGLVAVDVREIAADVTDGASGDIVETSNE
ncbi:MAG TPA: hypothetical protein VIM11_07370 [Tepidisphaeraceae bacterium]|jgi:hypothetical protein